MASTKGCGSGCSVSSMLKLLPFVASICLYFWVFWPEEIPTFWSTVVKCLPILSLALFVQLHHEGGNEKKSTYNRMIFAAILFSCVGDICLVWPDYFIHGVVSFGVAQILYIRATGVVPLHKGLGAIFITIAGIVLFLIRPGVMAQPLPLAAAVSLYSPILLGRVWLASSKLNNEGCGSGCSNFWAAAGALSFMVSDSVLSLNRFYTVLPYHQEIVMVTYYLAQLAVSMTIFGVGGEGTTVSKSEAGKGGKKRR